MKSRIASWRVLSAFGAACLLWPGHSFAQKVTYFDKPPSPEELSQALRNPEPSSAPAPLTRGLSRSSGSSGTSGNSGNHAGQRGIEWGMAPSQPTDQAAGRPPQQPTPANTMAAGHAGQRPAGNGPAVAIPVNFDSGSSQIRQNSLAYIDAIAQALQRDPALRLTVEGHTDASGNPNQNLMLSWDRALTVYKVLVSRYGIDPQRLQPMGKGPFEPIQGAGPTDSVQRRVQFRVISTE